MPEDKVPSVKALKNVVKVGRYCIPWDKIENMQYDSSDCTVLVEFSRGGHNTGWEECEHKEFEVLFSAWDTYIETHKPHEETVKRV